MSVPVLIIRAVPHPVVERLRVERLRQRVSQALLGLRADISPSIISAIERGYRAPTDELLDRIAEALGLEIPSLDCQRRAEEPEGVEGASGTEQDRE